MNDVVPIRDHAFGNQFSIKKIIFSLCIVLIAIIKTANANQCSVGVFKSYNGYKRYINKINLINNPFFFQIFFCNLIIISHMNCVCSELYLLTSETISYKNACRHATSIILINITNYHYYFYHFYCHYWHLYILIHQYSSSLDDALIMIIIIIRQNTGLVLHKNLVLYERCFHYCHICILFCSQLFMYWLTYAIYLHYIYLHTYICIYVSIYRIVCIGR